MSIAVTMTQMEKTYLSWTTKSKDEASKKTRGGWEREQSTKQAIKPAGRREAEATRCVTTEVTGQITNATEASRQTAKLAR